ncbi:MAG TPA: histidine phosphatase family protein, partial [Hyphomicrobiales bacterium]|nr:histidine phosphatase family protein [Hyphomicrobiales bacterium]
MPLIYFVRHGQTGWNAEKRMQGHLDIALNDTGR